MLRLNLIRLALIPVALAAACALGGEAAASSRPFGDARIFAPVPSPGNPEGLVLNGKTVFTGTTTDAFELATRVKQPSKLFAFARDSGELRYSIGIKGEDVSPASARIHGIAGLAFDADDRLYASDVQQGILRFELGRDERRQELYATLPDLPPCAVTVAGSACSPTLDDRPPLGNDIVFDRSGHLYVSDSWQATVFRVPRGGGEAEVWFQDSRLDGAFGANGIRLSPDGTELLLAVTEDKQGVGRVYRLPLAERPTAADLREVASWPLGGADGIAFGASGKLYVVLGSSNEISILRPEGGGFREEARLSSGLLHNPASPAFNDASRSLLVTNHAFSDPDPSHSTIVDLFVNDQGAPLVRPSIP